MHVTYATLQRINEKIVLVIESLRIGIRFVRQSDRNAFVLFVSFSLPSFLFFGFFFWDFLSKQIRMSTLTIEWFRLIPFASRFITFISQIE